MTEREGITTEKSGIDWAALLKRQEAAHASLALNRALSAQEEEALLKARAAELSRRPARTEPETVLNCLEFRLSGESYALEMSYVAETLPLTDFTPLFCTPPFVLGIINLRGRIVSIVDLRRFFELPAPGLSDLNRVMVVSNGGMEFGLLADAIVGMRELAASELRPPPATCTGLREEFLAGVTGERLALLNMEKILSDRRIVVHEEVA